AYAVALRRRVVEALVRCGGSRLARADARTDLQRFGPDAAGGRRRSGDRARARFAARQRREEWPPGAAVRHRCSRTSPVLPRLSAAARLLAQARRLSRVAARRDLRGRVGGCAARGEVTPAVALVEQRFSAGI